MSVLERTFWSSAHIIKGFFILLIGASGELNDFTGHNLFLSLSLSASVSGVGSSIGFSEN